jgi:hypothetical protein
MHEKDEMPHMIHKFCDTILMVMVALLPLPFYSEQFGIKLIHIGIVIILVMAKAKYPLIQRLDITLLLTGTLGLMGFLYEYPLPIFYGAIGFGSALGFLWIDDYYDRQIGKLTDPSWVWKFRDMNRDMSIPTVPTKSVVSLLDDIPTEIIREYILFRLAQSYAIHVCDYENADALGAIGARDPIQGMMKVHELHCKMLAKMKEEGKKESEIVKKAAVFSNYASEIPKYMTEVEEALKRARTASMNFFIEHADAVQNGQRQEGSQMKQVLEYQSLVLILKSMVRSAKQTPIRKIVILAKTN